MLFLENIPKRQIHRDKKQTGRVQWRVTANGKGISFGHDGNALKSDNSDACTTLNILKPTVLYTLKG